MVFRAHGMMGWQWNGWAGNGTDGTLQKSKKQMVEIERYLIVFWGIIHLRRGVLYNMHNKSVINYTVYTKYQITIDKTNK